MSMPSPPERLGRAIAAVADAEPRMRMLLEPSVDTTPGHAVIAFYWYDVNESVAIDTVIDPEAYAGLPPDEAAQRIISSLFA
jgi:hypothetical protein